MFQRKWIGGLRILKTSAHVRMKSYTSGDYCLNIVK